MFISVINGPKYLKFGIHVGGIWREPCLRFFVYALVFIL